MLARGPERRNWDSLVFGHRGCRFVPGIVENTMGAYQYALDKGADGIEIDVRLCASGELVVFHDEVTTPACVGPAREVRGLSKEEVASLVFHDDVTQQQRAPSVEDVLELCISRNCKLLFEVKHYSLRDIPTIVAAVLAYARSPKYAAFFREQCTIISFNPLFLYMLRRAAPELAVGPLYNAVTISDIATRSGDSPRADWLWALFPTVLDAAFAFFVDRIASGWMGASMTCTHVDLCSKPMIARHSRAGRVVYAYGLGSAMPARLAASQQICVACDDDHDMLRAAMQTA